jgi:pyrophosphate--fructose-6-phosphate 1-phosphotransferase
MKNTQQPTKTLLSRNEAVELTSSENRATRERMGFRPPRCHVFGKAVTSLNVEAEYAFKIDKEASRQLPDIIQNGVQSVIALESPQGRKLEAFHKQRNIGIVFSGGPAPGGHNVIAGLFDAAKAANPDSMIFGFLMGPDGIIENQPIEITAHLVDAYRNLGGFGMIKTGRTKIDTSEKMMLSRKTCRDLGLDALVIVGGDDSNTNAAFLAQEMIPDGVQVIGVPKTIDGDIQVRDARGKVLCAMSFGFHSAARSFAQQVSNLCTDCYSDVKYWHICKVMGRVASHLALEVALQTHPNVTLIGEELADFLDENRLDKAISEGTLDYTAYGMTLRQLSRNICDAIVRRASVGKNYGVIVIPEGILEFINEIQVFIIKLNTIIAQYNRTHDTDFHSDFPLLEEKREYLRRLARLSREEKTFSIWNTRDDDLFNDIPDFFQEGLLTERDAHGNFQFSLVETEKVLMDLVKDYLKILRERGQYRMGIRNDYFRLTLINDKLNPERFGPVLFENYSPQSRYLLVKQEIISLKILKQQLVREELIEEEDPIPQAVQKIYQKSVPKFKTQMHFYGYDGRGSDPTWFDCTYTYNLGLTVFSLIAGGATGQMAAIKNLEMEFDCWEPIGIPIAPLMHLEERKGKLSLVLEKSVVDTNSTSFRIFEALREKWLSAEPEVEHYRRPGPIGLFIENEESRPITLALNALDNGCPR